MTYDQTIREEYFDMADGETLRESYRQLAVKIFDTKVFNTMQFGDRITRPANNPQLFSADPALLNAYIGSAQYLKKLNEVRSKMSAGLLTQAKKLIEEIKKEYSLEDE